MNYNAKNYNTDGGDTTVIGGTLRFEEGAQVEDFPGGGGGGSEYVLPTASENVKGGVKVGSGLTMSGEVLSIEPAPAQADSTATDVAGLVEDYNSLLDKLRAAGFLAVTT